MFPVGFDGRYEKQAGNYLISCTRKGMPPETAEFVAQVYYHAVGFTFNVGYAELLCQLIEEDCRLQNYSVAVYTVYDSGRQILGTSRLVISRDNFKLPIQREFEIDLEKVISDNGPVGDVIEIGRLAVRGNSIRIIKFLFLAATVDFEENDLLLAAIDLQVLRRLNRLGFHFEEIGKPRYYRGSLTCPVVQSAREFKRKITRFLGTVERGRE